MINLLPFKKNEKWLPFLFAALYILFPTVLSASNVALALLVITWAVTLKKQNYNEIIKSTKVVWILCCLYLIVIIGSIYTPTDSHWILLHLKKYVTFLFAIILILLLTNRRDLQKLAMHAFIAGMLLILASTWLNIWFLLPWSKSQNLGWGASHHVVGDYITQNIMMAFFTIIALHKAIRAKRNIYKAIWAVVSVLAVISITHLSQGRTGLLMLGVGLISYLLVMVRGKCLAIYLLGTVIILGITIGSSSIIKSRISQAVEEVQRHDVDRNSSIGHRLYNYKTTPKLILKKPLFGHGTGAYHTEICRFIEKPSECQTYSWHPHNQFLLIGADHGLIGMVLYGLLILSLYYTALRSLNPDAKVWLCVLTTILLFDSLINSPFFSSRESQFFGYMIALLVSMCISKPIEKNGGIT